MAGFVIGEGNESNFFFEVAKEQGSCVFTEAFFAGELDRIRDTDKNAPLSYLKNGNSATVVVALPKDALQDLGVDSFDKIEEVAHDKIVAAVNKHQKARGGILFEFRSLFNGSISLNNLVNKIKEQTTLVPDNGLHGYDCKQIKEGIEKGSIIPFHYQSIYRLKDGDCRPIRCYCLVSVQDKL